MTAGQAEFITVSIGLISVAVAIINYLDKRDDKRIAKIKEDDGVKGQIEILKTRVKTLEDEREVCARDREKLDERFNDFLKDMFKLFQNQKQ